MSNKNCSILRELRAFHYSSHAHYFFLFSCPTSSLDFPLKSMKTINVKTNGLIEKTKKQRKLTIKSEEDTKRKRCWIRRKDKTITKKK